MRIYINSVDSYVGKALCSDLRKVAEGVENRLFGTLTREAEELDAQAQHQIVQNLDIKRVISRANRKQFMKDVLSCSLLAFDLHSVVTQADYDEVEQVLKELKLAKLDHKITVVLISSVTVWGRTKKEYVPLEGQEEEEEEAEAEEEEGEEGEAKEKKEVKKRPGVLKDVDMDRRTPLPGRESWKYLETLTLSLASKEQVRPHVIGAGVLYGNGEVVFNELFQEAWLTRPSHAVLAPGDNYIPCVHVRDVARLVRVVAMDASIGRYLLAVDKSRLTQAQIVQGIVGQLWGKKDPIPIVAAEEATMGFSDVMTLDLIMEASKPMRSKDFAWWSKKGIVANIEKVADEFCRWRNLRPIKLVVIGPPGAGAERLCKLVADKYLHDEPPHISLEAIIQEELDAGDAATRKLQTMVIDEEDEAQAEEVAGLESVAKAGRLLKKKLTWLAKFPGAQLPQKIRTRLLKKKLLSNVCKYRGYVLQGYPRSYRDAMALFTELRNPDGELAEEEEEEEEEEEAEPEEGEEEEAPQAPPPEEPEEPEEEEDEEDDEPKPKTVINSSISPEFAVVLRSAEERCKARIFDRKALGATGREEFQKLTSLWRHANDPEDGRPSTSDFFKEVAGLRVLHADVDTRTEEEVFQSVRAYLESKGQYFNYLRSEEDLNQEREAAIAEQERLDDEERDRQCREIKEKEEAAASQRKQKEATRLQAIAEKEASILETEAMPLRQYLMVNVVPTLSEGLTEVCKVMPEDPIEYLAEYLFAHASDVQLEEAEA